MWGRNRDRRKLPANLHIAAQKELNRPLAKATSAAAQLHRPMGVGIPPICSLSNNLLLAIPLDWSQTVNDFPRPQGAGIAPAMIEQSCNCGREVSNVDGKEIRWFVGTSEFRPAFLPAMFCCVV